MVFVEIGAGRYLNLDHVITVDRRADDQAVAYLASITDDLPRKLTLSGQAARDVLAAIQGKGEHQNNRP